MRHSLNLETVNTYEGAPRASTERGPPTRPRPLRASDALACSCWRLGSERSEAFWGRWRVLRCASSAAVFFYVSGTHDVHALILGKAITGLPSFVSGEAFKK